MKHFILINWGENLNKFHIADQQFRLIINTLPVGILLCSESGEIIFTNPKLDRLLGFDKSELERTLIERLIPVRYHEAHEKMQGDYLKSPSSRSMGYGRVLPIIKKNGEEIQVKIGLSPLLLGEEKVTVVSIIEITNHVFKIAAYHDPLTGLSNRSLFTELSENLHNLAKRDNSHVSIMFIDLDNFKEVNDHHGHAIGDMVLCEVADILSGCVRKNDVLGRLGGDEFIVYLYDMKNNLKLENISKKIIDQISSIDEINGYKINISASIGAVSTDSPVTVSLDDMIKKADRLMYKAKKAGKGRLCSEVY